MRVVINRALSRKEAQMSMLHDLTLSHRLLSKYQIVIFITLEHQLKKMSERVYVYCQNKERFGQYLF